MKLALVTILAGIFLLAQANADCPNCKVGMCLEGVYGCLQCEAGYYTFHQDGVFVCLATCPAGYREDDTVDPYTNEVIGHCQLCYDHHVEAGLCN
ncbi:Hypp7708 [Branchiostoma lanceolatum]|uniref:Hypp7708 protein n=1 Tax=Branchiostoma lanceolatum TaxID=7740 RepID=A0A8K0EEU8_BRALA|nr:Hypp7708 [Branchiostoma lanceolatum]